MYADVRRGRWKLNLFGGRDGYRELRFRGLMDCQCGNNHFCWRFHGTQYGGNGNRDGNVNGRSYQVGNGQHYGDGTYHYLGCGDLFTGIGRGRWKCNLLGKRERSWKL